MDTLLNVLDLFNTDPDLTAIIGSYDDSPGDSNFLSQYRNLFHHYTHQTSRELASTFWGACGAIRKEAFWEVGGFDPRYTKPSIEDIELGYRLSDRGYSIRLNKSLFIKHLKRWDGHSLLKADLFYRAVPWTELILSRKQMNNDLNLQYSTRLSIICLFGMILSLVLGFWWIHAVMIAAFQAILIMFINWKVYQFFYQKRGTLFMIRSIPFHWLYLACCGLGFSLGFIQFHRKALL